MFVSSEGVEPSHLAALAPEASVSAYFTTMTSIYFVFVTFTLFTNLHEKLA